MGACVVARVAVRACSSAHDRAVACMCSVLTSYSCVQRGIAARLSLPVRCPRWCQRWRLPRQRRRGRTARVLFAIFRLTVSGAACASAPLIQKCSAWLQLHGCMRCRPCRCACVLLCARLSSCVHVFCTDFARLRADAHCDAIVAAAGALPALVSALASSTSEKTREYCAIALAVISQTGVWCRGGMWPWSFMQTRNYCHCVYMCDHPRSNILLSFFPCARNCIFEISLP